MKERQIPLDFVLEKALEEFLGYLSNTDTITNVNDISSQKDSTIKEQQQNIYSIPVELINNPDKEYLLVRLEMPGIAKQDINIELKGDILYVTGIKKEQSLKDDIKNTEFNYGKYNRAIVLSSIALLNESKITAKLNNGILTIYIPKKNQQTMDRKIQIN